jgi:hypothetical protein
MCTGTVGFNQGFRWGYNSPSADDIDADNDGEMVPAHEFVIDLSEIASGVLGYQANMMKGYRLHGYQVSIRPRDDLNDNDQAAQFAGYLSTYPATDHAFKALQMARKVEKADEASQVDADSLFLSDDIDYSGFRYGWSTFQTGTVQHETGNSISGMSSTWLLSEIFAAYDDMTEPQQTNALFGGRAPEHQHLPWRAGWGTYPSGAILNTGGGFDCGQDYFYKTALDILPLIRGTVRYSTGDEAGAVDDDYYVQVTLEFTPEVGGGF